MKLTDIIKELEIKNPHRLNEYFLRKNIDGILEIIDYAYSYIDPNWEIEIVEANGSIDELENGWIVSNVDHPEIDECMYIFITGDLEAEYEGEGPVSSLEEYEYKGIKFKAQTVGC